MKLTPVMSRCRSVLKLVPFSGFIININQKVKTDALPVNPTDFSKLESVEKSCKFVYIKMWCAMICNFLKMAKKVQIY